MAREDILISIHRIHMDNIVSQTKNHEFRKYLISRSVRRMWFYVTKPDQTLEYIAEISQGKQPGEIELENGIGNREFNAGLKKDVAKFAYEIRHLYRLAYTYVKDDLLNSVVLKDQMKLF